MATSPQLIVTMPGGIQETFTTDKWYRRWEPTDEQLEGAKKQNSANDVPRLAHLQAVDVLVVMDAADQNMLAVFKDWMSFRVVA